MYLILEKFYNWVFIAKGYAHAFVFPPARVQGRIVFSVGDLSAPVDLEKRVAEDAAFVARQEEHRIGDCFWLYPF